jgi:uncharacterized protein with NAD-binding domain and iron-sulfur cluster
MDRSRLIEDNAAEIGTRARQVARTGGVAKAFAKMAGLAGFDPQEVEAGLSADFEAKGICDAIVVVRALPADDVAELLPRGLELAPQPSVGAGLHPVVVIAGRNAYEAWFGDMAYDEMLVAVPYVQRTDTHIPNRGPFLYMPRLYLNERRPRMLGNLLYGFEKVEAVIDNAPGHYQVRHEREGLLAELRYESAGPSRSSAGDGSLEAVRELLQMPTIAQSSRIADSKAFYRDGIESAFICANIRYLFDDPSAVIEPVRATLQVTKRVKPRALPTDTYVAPSLDEARLGAFRMRLPARVSMPGSAADTVFPPAPPTRRKRVVVLGGGPAACAAAFYLARQPERYQVSMYTLGWRLGGKCAAGRSEGAAERIEEHGLHAFLGFYNNAIRTISEVWSEAGLQIARPEGPVAGALLGKLDVGLMDELGGQWRYFPTGQRTNDGVPGTIPTTEGERLPGFGEVMLGVLHRVNVEVRELLDLPDAGDKLHEHLRQAEDESLWDRLVQTLERIVGNIHESSLAQTLDRLVDHLQEVAIEEIAEGIAKGRALFDGIAWLLRLVRASLVRHYDDEEVPTDADAWFRWSNLDMVITIAIGIIESRAPHFDALDRHDFRGWLLAHGMDERNRNISAVRMVYDTLFANADEAPVRAEKLACGVALRWFLLVGFRFEGYPAYDFRLSCPQTIFTPYYRALTKLGVDIHFFHRVEDLQVLGDDEDRQLAGIRMRRQATVRAGSAAYDPFVPSRSRHDPDGIDAWPLRPRWEQLEEGETLREQGIDLEDAWSGWGGVDDVILRKGEDFDLCVLGIPHGALAPVTEQLTDETSPSFSPAWAEMIAGITVCRTFSFQLWFDCPAEEMYSGAQRDLLTGFVPPWPSMGEFTHLVQWEGWPADMTPKFLAYHTGAQEAGAHLDEHPFHEAGYPQRVSAQTQEQIIEWLREHHGKMYDRVTSWDDFCARLTAPPELQGEDRLRYQYFTARVQPSDLYVLSRPGEIRHRLGQGESGVRDLFLCGDWTRTDLNCGCVEAATQSGMLAARVISGLPRYVWHPGF